MSLLAQALREERWEVVALCLLQGWLQVATQLPPGTVQDLLDVLGSEDRRRA